MKQGEELLQALTYGQKTMLAENHKLNEFSVGLLLDNWRQSIAKIWEFGL